MVCLLAAKFLVYNLHIMHESGLTRFVVHLGTSTYVYDVRIPIRNQNKKRQKIALAKKYNCVERTCTWCYCHINR